MDVSRNIDLKVVTVASTISSVLEETDPPSRASACLRQRTDTGDGGLAPQPYPSHLRMESREQQTRGRRAGLNAGRRAGERSGEGARGKGPWCPLPVPGCPCRPSARSMPTARFSAVASYSTQVAASTKGHLAGMDCRQIINVREVAVITPAHLAFPSAMSLYWDGVWQSLFSNHSFFTVKGYFPQAASRDFIV